LQASQVGDAGVLNPLHRQRHALEVGQSRVADRRVGEDDCEAGAGVAISSRYYWDGIAIGVRGFPQLATGLVSLAEIVKSRCEFRLHAKRVLHSLKCHRRHF
jgi:hypothetical protein